VIVTLKHKYMIKLNYPFYFVSSYVKHVWLKLIRAIMYESKDHVFISRAMKNVISRVVTWVVFLTMFYVVLLLMVNVARSFL